MTAFSAEAVHHGIPRRSLSREEAEHVIDGVHELADDPFLRTSQRAIHARQAALFEVICCTTFPLAHLVALSLPSLIPWLDIKLTSDIGISHRFLSQRAIHSINRWKRLATLEGVISQKWVFHTLKPSTKPLSRTSAYLDLKAAAHVTCMEEPERVTMSAIRKALGYHP